MRTLRRFLPLALLALAGCFSLPPPAAPERAAAGTHAPDFSLPRTGSPPGKLSLADLTSGTTAVLVFYRGHW